MTAIQLDTRACVNIIGGIIRQAIEDLSGSNETIRANAREYLYSEDFDFYCSSIGSNVTYIRQKIGLPPELDIELLGNKRKRLEWGALKRMTEKELKEYRSNYRKMRAKRLFVQKA